MSGGAASIDRHAATEELKRLYPPDECQRLIANGSEEVVEGLFWS